MGLPTRPDLDEFIQITSELADARAKYSELEYTFEKTRARNIKNAMDNHVKTRAIDYIKVLGNSEKEEQYLDWLKKQMIDLNRQITVLYGRARAWEAGKDLYRSDSYHMIKGSTPLGDDNDD